MELTDFQEFPKIARLNREIVVSEKIDGSNAQIVIANRPVDRVTIPPVLVLKGDLALFAASRSRFVTPGAGDNFGFAAWAIEHAEELFMLGEGRHYGEWWGADIQRGYGLAKGDRRFSLFNTARWGDPATRPACCGVVPVLYQGIFSEVSIQQALNTLKDEGSKASPGFMNPEGIVVYHTAAKQMFKVTVKNDGVPKTLVKE